MNTLAALIWAVNPGTQLASRPHQQLQSGQTQRLPTLTRSLLMLRIQTVAASFNLAALAVAVRPRLLSAPDVPSMLC